MRTNLLKFPKCLLGATLGLAFAVGVCSAGANGIASDELKILDATGVVLFDGFLTEGLETPPLITSPLFPLALIGGIGSIKAPGLLFLTEPGLPDIGSDQIVVTVIGTDFFIELRSDMAEEALAVFDPRIVETGELQDITDFLFVGGVLQVFAQSDVGEVHGRAPEPATLALLALGLLLLRKRAIGNKRHRTS